MTKARRDADLICVLTGSEGGRDAGPHHGSKQHVESQDILRVMGHVLQLVLCGAAVQSHLPGTVPTRKLWEQTSDGTVTSLRPCCEWNRGGCRKGLITWGGSPGQSVSRGSWDAVPRDNGGAGAHSWHLQSLHWTAFHWYTHTHTQIEEVVSHTQYMPNWLIYRMCGPQEGSQLHVLTLAVVMGPSVSPKIGLMVTVYSEPAWRPWIM